MPWFLCPSSVNWVWISMNCRCVSELWQWRDMLLDGLICCSHSWVLLAWVWLEENMRAGGGGIKENETIADCLEIKGSCCFCISLSQSYFHSLDRDACFAADLACSLVTEDALPWLEFLVRSRSHLIRRPQLCTHSVTRSGGAAWFAVRLRWEFFFAPKLA